MPVFTRLFDERIFDSVVFDVASGAALMYAQGAIARGGATRGGYHSSRVFVSLNGVQYGYGRANQAQKVLHDSLLINDILDQTPNTADLTVVGFTPSEGHEVVVTLGSINTLTRLFAGNVLTRDQVYISKPSIIEHQLNAIDYSWLLNRRKVIGRYLSQSATSIARDLITTFAPGFTANHVATDLPAIDEITFTNQDMTEALTNLAKRVGAYWYVDYHKDVHIFLAETTETDPTQLTAVHPTLMAFSATYDLSQIVTRVWVEGGGVNSLAELSPGDTIIPVDDTAWYSTVGGYVVSGPQRISYTGIQEQGAGAIVGTGSLPSVPPSLTLQSGSGLGTGLYQYAYTDVTAAGESLPSPTATITTGGSPLTAPTISNDGLGGSLVVGATYSWKVTFVSAAGESSGGPATAPYTAVTSGYADQSLVASLTNIPIGPSGTTARKLYRTAANGSSYLLVNGASVPAIISDNTTTTWLDGSQDPNLGSAIPTAGFNQVALSGISVGPASTTQRKIYRTIVNGSQLKLLTTLANNTATTFSDSTADGSLGANVPTADTSGLTQPQGQFNAGSTSITLTSTAPFSATGGWARIGGDQVIRYAGISGNTLTGIPSAGSGSIGATIVFNSTVTVAPAIIGVPASGAGAIRQTILVGDPINLLAQVDDTAAQATLAALLGGDGIQEDYLQDRRISQIEAHARGTAQLALRSRVEVGIRYRTRDKNTKAGRSVTVTLPAPTNVTGTFKIQSVRVADFHPEINHTPAGLPVYEAVASTTRFSLEDLLRIARKAVA